MDCSTPGFFYFFIFYFFISWRLITLQYCSGFCHTLKWISHRFTCAPHPDPPSHLPLHPIPLGLPSAPGPSACLMHPTWAGDLFHPRYYTCFDAVLLKHPTLAFSQESKSLNLVAIVTICSDFGAQENKVCHCFHCFPIYLPWSDGNRCYDLHFLNVEFYTRFSTLLFHLHQETPPLKALIYHGIAESRIPGEPFPSQSLPWGPVSWPSLTFLITGPDTTSRKNSKSN